MKMKYRLFGISGVIIILLLSVCALVQATEGVTIDPVYLEKYQTLYDNSDIQKGLAYIEADHDNRVAETIEFTKIPAPPFNEDVRAAAYAERFKALGLEDVSVDLEGNAIGYYRGTVGKPKLLFTAHMDTVFEPGYDTTVTIDEDGWIHAPGIGDDSAGLSMVLSLIRALNEAKIKPVGDIMFAGTVGEEGRGDLRGVKYLFSSNDDIDAFVSVDCDPAPEGKLDYSCTTNALGSYRFEFSYKGPGGHSNGAYGTVSALHAMARGVAKMADMQVAPGTTYTASVVEGGTSVNAIAAECMLQTDTRAQDPAELIKSTDLLVKLLKQGVEEENARWAYEKGGEVTLEVNLVGVRPSGIQSMDTPTVQSALAMAMAMPEFTPIYREDSGSTDSNLPISLGVPALTIGKGGSGKSGHALPEQWNPEGAWQYVQAGFLFMVGLVGMDGVTEPALPAESPKYEYKFEGLPFIPSMYIVPGKHYKLSWVDLVGN